MKKLALALVLLITAPTLSRAESGALALLWVPRADSAWQDSLDSFYAAKSGGFKMTVAVSPLAATAVARRKMQALEDEGRLELPLRIMGDPVLPLLFSLSNAAVLWNGKPAALAQDDRMDEAAARLYAALESYKKSYQRQPSGWVPAGGGQTEEMLPLLGAYEFKWAATGACPGDYTIAVSSGVQLVPFEMVSDTGSLAVAIASAAVAASPVFAVIDENLLGDAAEPVRAALEALFTSTPPVRALTVSEAVMLAPSTSALSCPLHPWSGDYGPWAATQRQSGALLNLGAARRDFALFAAANQAKGSALRQIRESFAELDTGERFLRLASTDSATAEDAEHEFKNLTENIYRLMDKPLPPSFLRQLSDAGSAPPPAGEEQAAGKNGSATITEGDGMLLLQNPAKAVKLPEGFSYGSSKVADPYAFFNPEALSIRWTPQYMEFSLKNSRTDEATRQALLPRLLTDIYIDLNHRARSGSINLLPYRQLRASSEDAWEFALTFTNGEARLFKATPQGMDLIGRYGVSATPEGELLVRVPRKVLSGNPPLWGYLVLSMVYGSDPGAGSAFKPLGDADSAPVVDYMALDRIGSNFYFLRLPRKYQ